MVGRAPLLWFSVRRQSPTTHPFQVSTDRPFAITAVFPFRFTLTLELTATVLPKQPKCLMLLNSQVGKSSFQDFTLLYCVGVHRKFKTPLFDNYVYVVLSNVFKCQVSLQPKEKRE